MKTTPTSLAAKTLAKGDCGLFGWTPDQAREFIFYADETGGKFAVDGQVRILTSTDPFPAKSYVDAQGRPISITLGQAELMNGGMRYPAARIRSETDEGWERLTPVALVESCQPA